MCFDCWPRSDLSCAVKSVRLVICGHGQGGDVKESSCVLQRLTGRRLPLVQYGVHSAIVIIKTHVGSMSGRCGHTRGWGRRGVQSWRLAVQGLHCTFIYRRCQTEFWLQRSPTENEKGLRLEIPRYLLLFLKQTKPNASRSHTHANFDVSFLPGVVAFLLSVHLISPLAIRRTPSTFCAFRR